MASWALTMRKRLQQLVFQDRIRYNKEKDTYRTGRVNSMFALIPYLKRVSGNNKSGLSNKMLLNSAFVPGTRIELVQPQWPQDFKTSEFLKFELLFHWEITFSYI